MWKWYLGAALLDLLGLIICLYFIFRHKRKAKAIEHYEDIRDELTVRKEITKEAVKETTGIGLSGIAMQLMTIGIIIAVGATIMQELESELATTEEDYYNTTLQSFQALTVIADLIPLFIIIGIMSAGFIIVYGALKGGELI